MKDFYKIICFIFLFSVYIVWGLQSDNYRIFSNLIRTLFTVSEG